MTNDNLQIIKKFIDKCGEFEGCKLLFLDKKVSELLEIKNFGKKSLKEVREKLAQFNMQLPDDDGSIDDDGGNDE